jgi:hypothetical protein
MRTSLPSFADSDGAVGDVPGGDGAVGDLRGSDGGVLNGGGVDTVGAGRRQRQVEDGRLRRAGQRLAAAVPVPTVPMLSDGVGPITP